ncbi:hypothetical protein [Shewanella sp.]|uniref:hypothetical protein n=1 Tax=Shewanella sp. TaxID=50422 RepID=UPI0040540851
MTVLVTFILQTSVSFADGSIHGITVKTLINLFKNDDRAAISRMVSYPLSRKAPLSSVNTEAEFISRFEQIFDAELIKLIAKSNPETDWSAVGEQGIMLAYGLVWLDLDGKIISVNYESNVEKSIRHKLIDKQKGFLHESVKDFNKPILAWRTKGFHIRIDDLGENYFRYTSWSVNKSQSQMPDLILLKGNIIFEGSGGNHYYSFSNGDYIYRCYVGSIGNDTFFLGRLTVFKANQILLTQPVIDVLSD